jgi:hypothetical protein
MSNINPNVRGFKFRGNLPKLDFDVQIHFVSAADLPPFDEQAAQESEDPMINPARLPLEPEMQERLKELEPEILQWLAADLANVVAFAGDPISALSRIRPDLEPDLIDRLRQVRAETEIRSPWPEEVRLRSLRLSAGNDEEVIT